MAATAAISIEQYLKTSYTPDCEYIDGDIRGKPVVGFPHGNVQSLLSAWFINHARKWRIKVAVETRTRVTGSKVRLPDLVVVPLHVSATQGVLESPPLIAIEVLSPDDSYHDLRQRARDLRAMGTPNIWLIDPAEKTIALWDGLTWQPFQGKPLQATGTEAYLDLTWLWTEFT